MRFFVGLTSLFFASAVFFSFADERAPSAPCEAEPQAESAQKLCKSDAGDGGSIYSARSLFSADSRVARLGPGKSMSLCVRPL